MNKKYIENYTSREIEYLKIRDLYNERKINKFLILSTFFLKKYPDDKAVRYLRGKVYMRQEQYKKAIEDFKIVNKENNDLLASEELFFIYYSLRMYNEALKLVPILKKSNYISAKNIKIMSLVMKNELGLLNLHDKFNLNDYSEYQVLDYNKDEALKHINMHKSGKIGEKSQFKSNLNIKYLFEIVEKNLPIAKRSKKKAQMDVYYIGISGVGYSKTGEISNCLKVIVVPNTYNIISMYPVNNINDQIINIEYDYDKLFSIKKSKVKKISQIEKFNKRYQKSTD